ncbi:hypothetical protein ACFSKN_02155 [Mariniflexile gromovii]|uniref:Uncharacterized protein n=1 Tax=Mariniflexile gromovii TaxID=362523 RepID=A0ABS4BPA1_9FLAO|nr:hypothetical protein [Mariniflexile gromovii]MBP0902405.1 hypothetical protein [Mariniflexile gromovii]
MKTVSINEFVNLKMMLNPSELKLIEKMGSKTYFLQASKHKLLESRYRYEIREAYITIFDIMVLDIQDIISIINF